MRSLEVDDGCISEEFFEVLALYRPHGSTIFPNIRRLNWFAHALDAVDNFTIPMFLGPTIIYIDIDLSESALPYDFLQVIHHKCPRLQELNISGGENLATEPRYGFLTTDGLYTAVTSLKSLTTLSMDVILNAPEMIVALGTKLKLRVLALTVSIPRYLAAELKYPDNFCASLEILRLRADSETPAHLVVDFLRAISSKQLREVLFVPAASHTSVDHTSFGDIFTALSRHMSLQHIRIFTDGELQWNTLSPLFKLTELQELDLSTNVVLTQADLVMDTPIWPQLQKLELWPSGDFEPEHTLPLSVFDLPTFLSLWPNLTELAVPFDAKTASSAVGTWPSPTKADRRVKVKTWLCPIRRDRIGEISDFLSRTIPGVELDCISWQILTGNAVQNNRTVGWELVKQMIPTLCRFKLGGQT